MPNQDLLSQSSLISVHLHNNHSVKPHSIERFSTILNAYIVVFKPETDQETALTHYNEIEEIQQSDISHTNQNLDYGIIHKYEIGSFKGYSGKFSSSVISTIQTYEEVDYIEQDKHVQAACIQNQAPWGLARISHKEALTDNTFNKYLYNKHAGKHVTVYIMDSGIYEEHEDFGGRASFGVNFLKGSPDNDTNGHGTHSAGIIGGKRYGVAKKAKLVSVKILDENATGSVSNAIAGIDWIVKCHEFDIQKSLLKGNTYKGAVATLNFITTSTKALNKAVIEGIYGGVTIIVPAGNDGQSACDYSPPSVTAAIKVGSSTYYDKKSLFSNNGNCVNIYAPGQSIISAGNSHKNSKRVLSGTSEAASHVAGLAAYFISMREGQNTPEYIKSKIMDIATPDVILELDPYGRSTLKPIAFNGFKL
ncbi:serine protease [Phycomyces blakesleeanus]|uniref:Peptidase S8/S53 domain-containing protein n=2 Tax=Phycomyces blakesleeanus TaxID=4837 RepID=A0A162Q7N6_PHYB8|nr:hypothetical protein PHYBLDRAFT_153967 [Phycomyces blakesleeanus NRRL 1555(-)]OAD80806.1 hypothetical protein PHYBLDRAFT_153967 [Phycomyces blakesleeanus NRRL 1555(-)]|eukprot:XP_018298846.1 hypothetical protein PHYBLDRAFT_153967 [Phycomyces blakesleeanus NRRL 1555(-)]